MSGAGANYGAAAPAPECEELPRGIALDQWDFFGVPRRGDHGNESGYGEAFYILTLWDKLVAAGARPTRAVANLGANDGVSGDPTFELFEAGWSGLAVEPSKAVHEGFAERPLWERLWENLPWDRVVKDDTPVTPDNVIAIFERAHLPLDLDVLKIDLDSYDIFVVERLLRHSRYRPKIIVMEISEAALGARVHERARASVQHNGAGNRCGRGSVLPRAQQRFMRSCAAPPLAAPQADPRPPPAPPAFHARPPPAPPAFHARPFQTRRSRRPSCLRQTSAATGTGRETISWLQALL
jgi:hypothetical protein